MTLTPSRILLSVALAALVIPAGCSKKHYRESADKEVYKILGQKQAKALGDVDTFTIEKQQMELLEGLPQRAQPLPGTTEATLGATAPGTMAPAAPESKGPEPSASGPRASAPAAQAPEAPRIVSIEQALRIAILNSRSYQSRKEDLYLSALALTLERHQWSPRFSGFLSGRREWADGDERWVGDSQFGVRQLFATGAELGVNVSTDFLRHITGDPRETLISSLSATLVQPLWRGAGRRIAQENLRQAERDVIYDVRSFAQFNRDFLVAIATNYYGLLQQREVVGNEWRSYERYATARDRSQKMAEAGRLPEFQVDQAKQEEFRAKDRWIRSVQAYRQALDEFKIDLGLPTEANIDVDITETQDLLAQGLIHPEIRQDEAVAQAMALRLDLLNAHDQVDDAERKVDVAANGLAPDVDLVLTANVPGENRKPAKFVTGDGTYSAGLEVELPLDRKAERNTYRRAIIFYERSRRDAESLTDTITLQVRQDWRRLQEERESYEIQRNSLALARRRVQSTEMLQQAGRATTRDLLEAQEDLLEAENALISTLVSHTIARLQLWRDMGTLLVNPEGKLEEANREHAVKPE